jgi:hypothetical protein
MKRPAGAIEIWLEADMILDVIEVIKINILYHSNKRKVNDLKY